MSVLTKTTEVLAAVAAGGTIGPGERQGLLELVDRAGNGVSAWQTALRAAANKLGQAVQFKIRMPGLLKQQLEEAAGNARRSVSAEIIHRLENSLADAVPTTSVIECLGLPPVALAPARAGRTYIAGPMTGLPDFNHPAFNAAAVALRAQGRTVINPADHGVVTGAAWADYVRADLALLAGCETIYLLPGWSRSRGALLEHHVARALGMPVEFADGAEVEAEGQMLADHVLLNELSGNSEQLAPAIDLEQPIPGIFNKSDTVAVPREMIAAACGAILHAGKYPADRILAQLRRYTTGDLSKPQPAPAIDLEQFRPAVFCMRNYTGVLPRSYWDKGSKAFSDEADRLRALIDGQASVRSSSEHSSEAAANLVTDDAVRRLVRAMENTPGDDLIEPNTRLCRRLLVAALQPTKGEGE